MLTGELPFRGASATSRLVLRTRSRAPLLTDLDPALPRRLSDIVARCLEPRAEDRYQTGEQVRDDLDASRPGPRARQSKHFSDAGHSARLPLPH